MGCGRGASWAGMWVELHSAFKSWGIGDRVVYMIFGISHMLLAAHRARRRAGARKKSFRRCCWFCFHNMNY